MNEARGRSRRLRLLDKSVWGMNSTLRNVIFQVDWLKLQVRIPKRESYLVNRVIVIANGARRLKA